MGGREADQITVGRGADMRVKELVLRVGNFPRNQSAHPAGCGVGPRAERQGGRQVAAMRPLGNAAQGISKATEHVSQLSLVVRGLPHALGRSWSLYPSPKLPASSSSGKPRPLSAVWEPERGRHPRRRLMRSQLRSPRGSHGQADLSLHRSSHHFTRTGLRLRRCMEVLVQFRSSF